MPNFLIYVTFIVVKFMVVLSKSDQSFNFTLQVKIVSDYENHFLKSWMELVPAYTHFKPLKSSIKNAIKILM